ncbi:MAG: elongation factor G [Actinomycetia bacterium]|nr:elongation factor G [Actinomycetes bacterium]
MTTSGIEEIRNVVLVGHGGAGKTSLAEALLFLSGATPRLGSVDAGQSILDYDSEEIKRQYTINLSLAPVKHGDYTINIIDTPGYADFIGDAIAGMEAAEAALFVVDAVSGPQVITDRLWKVAGEMGIPRAIFINRMDKEHANFDETLRKLQSKYGEKIRPVQLPIGKEDDFSGVIDLVGMKAVYFDGKKEKIEDIPADLIDAAEAAYDSLADVTAEADDDLLMKYLDGEALTKEEMASLIKPAFVKKKLIPVFVGSSVNLVGINALMDRIVRFFPDPSDHAPMLTTEDEEVEFDVSKPFSGHVFKTLSDPYVGRLSFVKIVTGELKPGTEIINTRTGDKARIPQIMRAVGKETEALDAGAKAGDIIVLSKLNNTLTNDTLSAGHKVHYADLPIPEPLYPVALVAKTKADEDKLGSTLKTMIDEDPTLTLTRDDETKQTVISALGDTAIEVLMSRLHERYHVETELVDLRIPYRETIRKTAQAQGRHKKQSGGSGQFGDCWLRLEPNTGNGYEFVDEIIQGRIPRQFIPAVDKGVQETMLGGVLAGYPVQDVKVAVYDGSYHSVDSNEMAFRTAARIGFKAAAEKANPIILEPMAYLEILVPDDYAGAVMGDMSGIRGRVMGMDAPEAGVQLIKALAPYAEVVHYSPHLRSLSHGTGTYTIKLEGYEQVPGDLQKQIIADYEAAREAANK